MTLRDTVCGHTRYEDAPPCPYDRAVLEAWHSGRLVERDEAVDTVSWCFAHNDGDIKVRQYSDYSCPSWHPDDECRIGLAYVVEKYPTDAGDTL